MPRLFNRKIFLAIAIPSLMMTVALEATAGKPPIRSANSRTQTDPPPAPTPDPLLSSPPGAFSPGPAPGTVQPSPGLSPAPGNLRSTPAPVPSSGPSPAPSMMGNGTPGTPTAPVPPPEPGGGAMYSNPFGTMREAPLPPPKVYTGDPGGLGSGSVPSNSATPTPLDPNQVPPALDQYPSPPTTDRFGVLPPPGTLGQTYSRRSRLISEKKHPRVGIVEVHLSENYDVSALGLKSNWTGKAWELESDPLLPGIPHIFEVKAEWGPEGAKMKEVRTVRLIMGRVVDLDF